MNKSRLKDYARQARREFIQAIKDRAATFGLKKDKTAEAKLSGDFAIISGQAFPKAVAEQRDAVEEKIHRSSFEQVIEEIAYTWFNRFVAIRYMELHGFLSHGYRVLSNPAPDNSTPEILEKAQHIQLHGLDVNKVLELKMDGTKDEELYRMLLIAQCNELNRAMPFLFESIKDYTELLMPDNLLHSDSLIRKLVAETDEADWQQVEIIGWLYQFYISEKKDEVIGNVVKSEDIPAATQLFTPNWIVKYLVQNSLGAQWMRTYPNSALKGKMEYYIEPAEQTPEVQKQLAEITPATLNPEELTLLDPACGSGHMLVEAYDLLKEIYLERGYRRRDLPELILRKNLFGLEIDDRAAQLAGFAVMMKAKADDRQLFEKHIVPNIVSIQETKELDVKENVRAINAPLTDKDIDNPASLEELQVAIEAPLFAGGLKKRPVLDEQEKLTVDDLQTLLGLFEHGKTFGSLIRIPDKLAEKLPAMAARVNNASKNGNLSAFGAAKKVLPFINQALIMAGKYDAVVANPPYMGSKGINVLLKNYAGKEFPDTKTDLFAMFIERGFEMAKQATGHNAMVTMQSWMFLSSFEEIRQAIIEKKTIFNMAHLGPRAFSTISGEVVTVTAFSIFNKHLGDYKPSFLRLIEGNEEEKLNALKKKDNLYNNVTQNDFNKIPGSPIAYWVSDKVRKIFEEGERAGDIVPVSNGIQTGNNDKSLRLWPEVSRIEFGKKWFPYNKGGEFRRWYGNNLFYIDWNNDGSEIKSRSNCCVRGEENYFKMGITWSDITTGNLSCRLLPKGFLFDAAGPSAFPATEIRNTFLGFMNTKFVSNISTILNPTLHFQAGNFKCLPFIKNQTMVVATTKVVELMVELSKTDWDSFETSWDFSKLAVISQQCLMLEEAYKIYRQHCREITAKMKELEEENNRLFTDAYGLQDELTPNVLEEEITLFANPKYHYGGNLSEEELEKRFREDTIQELISYSVGCMMGRYSLDEPGLIYANSGNEGFDLTKYKKFRADPDGIIPITDFPWFEDDTVERFFKFIETVWDKGKLEENLDFVAESIGRKASESGRDAIRRFFCNDFFKDHLQRYKKRPIYWLFTSGKEKALQCLVYLHRYNEGTLARMRTEYLIPLQGKINSRIEGLQKDIDHASSTSAANKIRKEIITLEKQAEELRKFDEKLRHYADMKIKLDLDDGVKVNYGKFGDLLAEVKAICGEKEDDE